MAMIEITDHEFQAISKIMYERTGVRLKDTKKPLVMSRLRMRLERLQLASFSEYIKRLENRNGEEMEVFINALTTNETYFFRHTKQFNYLYEVVLPKIVAEKKGRGERELLVWTAACSTGEEPYSLAITLREFCKTTAGVHWKLYASDINSRVLATAKEGLYSDRSLKELSDTLRTRYFQEAEQESQLHQKKYLLSDEIKKSVQFMQHNLLEHFSQKNFDVIFLRNVMIYFDPKSKQQVVNNLEENVSWGGYLFISLSETLNDVRTHFKLVYSGVYQKVRD